MFVQCSFFCPADIWQIYFPFSDPHPLPLTHSQQEIVTRSLNLCGSYMVSNMHVLHWYHTLTSFHYTWTAFYFHPTNVSTSWYCLPDLILSIIPVERFVFIALLSFNSHAYDKIRSLRSSNIFVPPHMFICSVIPSPPPLNVCLI